jgi:hypothetical protein
MQFVAGTGGEQQLIGSLAGHARLQDRQDPIRNRRPSIHSGLCVGAEAVELDKARSTAYSRPMPGALYSEHDGPRDRRLPTLEVSHPVQLVGQRVHRPYLARAAVDQAGGGDHADRSCTATGWHSG